MLPGNVDPRRADKQQRYKPPPSSNNAAPGEDLTPDYMNILDSQKKSMHSSNRSDRFKVVKIESTEPFKRGRWECMDFLDQSYSRILQHNYVACKSSDTNVSTTNGSRLEPPKRNTSTSWGTNNDLQSSMLRIFYRQNTSIAHDTSKSCTPKSHSAESAEALNQALYSDNSYRNHVLRPGMVSSSLVGVKYPFELNFEVNTDPAISNNSGAILSQQTCPCNNNYSSDVSNNLVIKAPEISTEPQLYIQNTSVPTYQQFNYAQQNYSTPNNNGQNIYQNGNGTTVNMFQNFNTSPRQQVNSFQISNNANGIFSVPTTIPVNTNNTSFGTDVYSYSDPNNVAHIVPTTNVGSSSASNYQQFPNVQQPSYQSQNTVTTTPILNTSQFENPPMYETLLQTNQSQSKFNTSTPTNNSIGNESVQVQGMSQLKIQQTNQQNVHMTMINNHHSGIVHVIKTNMQSSTACVNNQSQGTTHKTSPPNCQRVLFPDTLPSTNGVYTTSFVVPVYPQEENVAQNIVGNVSNPGYVAIPSNITPEQTTTAAPSQPLSLSQHRAVEACVYSILGVDRVPSTTNVNDAPTPINAKIEALMDLVTNHLKVAVLNDMQELKQHIEALNERIAELERENNLLKCMIFSMCGLMMRLKWCAWVALYCSCISFANSRLSDDTKQILSSFMLSISAVVMSYLQNPQPMTPPWASAVS